jgi:hypothetical protein
MNYPTYHGKNADYVDMTVEPPSKAPLRFCRGNKGDLVDYVEKAKEYRGDLVDYVEKAKPYPPRGEVYLCGSGDNMAMLQQDFYLTGMRGSGGPRCCTTARTMDEQEGPEEGPKEGGEGKRRISSAAAFGRWEFKARRISNRKTKGRNKGLAAYQ